jgi:hypothetical protein
MAIDNDGYNGDEEDEEEMALNTSRSYETSKVVHHGDPQPAFLTAILSPRSSITPNQDPGLR